MPYIDPQRVARAYRIKAEIKALEAEHKEIMEGLGLDQPDKYVAGDFIIEVAPNVRFDEATAKRNLDPETFKSILKPKPDSALAKALLGDDYSLTQKSYGVKRTIKRVEDAE